MVRDSLPASMVPGPGKDENIPAERTSGRGLLLPSALASAWGLKAPFARPCCDRARRQAPFGHAREAMTTRVDRHAVKRVQVVDRERVEAMVIAKRPILSEPADRSVRKAADLEAHIAARRAYRSQPPRQTALLAYRPRTPGSTRKPEAGRTFGALCFPLIRCAGRRMAISCADSDSDRLGYPNAPRQPCSEAKTVPHSGTTPIARGTASLA